MRDAVEAADIGLPAASGAPAVVMAPPPTAGRSKASTVGMLLKVGAGVVAAGLAAGFVVAVSTGGVGESAPMTGVPPVGVVDESIRDVDFADVTVTELDAAQPWLSNTGVVVDELSLTNGEATLSPNVSDTYMGDVTVTAREPVFADLNNDGLLDAVMVIDMAGYMNAHDFQSLVVAWRQSSDGPVQVDSIVFGYGFHQGLWGHVVEEMWADDGLRMTISSSVGVHEAGGSIREEETIRLALYEDWLVRNEPSYGAAHTCLFSSESSVIVEDPTVVRVANSPDAPRIGVDGDGMTAEVAWGQDGRRDGLLPARVTRDDGGQTCGWVPNADVSWPE